VLSIAAGVGGLISANGSPMAIVWPLPLGTARLALDGLSAWYLLAIGLVTIPVSVYAWGYFNKEASHGPVGAFAPLMCVLIAAMLLVATANDAVMFLVGWESMSLSAFLLVGFHDEDAAARRGAWMYLIATHLGTMVGVFPLLAAFVARSGSTDFAGFRAAFAASDTAWCVALFTLSVVGFGTKAGFMPFHVWLPAAHPVAPSPVSALMSGLVIKTGIYALLRTLSWLPALPVVCSLALLALAIITGVVGILYALQQREIKRMLAYSSVENIGIVGIAVALGMLGRSLHQPALAALGFGGALLHVVNHALFKGLLFLSAGAAMRATGTGDVERLGGLARKAPTNTLAFLVGAVAICALPPLNGFFSEFLMYTGFLRGLVALPNTYAWAAVVAIAALAVIGGVALLGFSRVFGLVFLGEPRDTRITVRATPPTMTLGMSLLVGGCVAAGVGAVWLTPALHAAMTPIVAGERADAAALSEALAALSHLALPLGLLLAMALLLVLCRQRMPRGALAGGSAGTWGCGFTAPTPRMQYTASSYGWSLLRSLPSPLRSQRTTQLPAGCFPSEGSLRTHPRDIALDRGFKPLFNFVARFCERLWPLQHGRIQLYLGYIVATVAIVFLAEAWVGPVAQSRTSIVPADAARSAETHVLEANR
jgi:hydrogenase-4 component B